MAMNVYPVSPLVLTVDGAGFGTNGVTIGSSWNGFDLSLESEMSDTTFPFGSLV